MSSATVEGGERSVAARTFRYTSFDFDAATHRLVCRYALDGLEFSEVITFPRAASTFVADERVVAGAARLVFLLAGVSYFKAAAPPVIEVPGGLRLAERALLRSVYYQGLGEYAYENGLDLSGVAIEADGLPDEPAQSSEDAIGTLVPFGGGLDSIVTVEGLRARTTDPALFIVSGAADRFAAIERSAAATKLPIVRAERRIDEKVLRSRELGYRNGHVPVTGILSSIAVLAAVLDGRRAVAMSNEWSASAANLEWNGLAVNHQWSKGLEFEDLFRAALAATVPGGPDYFSWLRPRSELWVARQFASLPQYHQVFRSCNRAFHIDPTRRLDRWCGRCDKCCFIDLILSPFMAASELKKIFGGREPLQQPDLVDRFRTLIGTSENAKPFECVGDIEESRVAIIEAARRSDRVAEPFIHQLAAEARGAGVDEASLNYWLSPLSEHRIPADHAPRDLLE